MTFSTLIMALISDIFLTPSLLTYFSNATSQCSPQAPLDKTELIVLKNSNDIVSTQ